MEPRRGFRNSGWKSIVEKILLKYTVFKGSYESDISDVEIIMKYSYQSEDVFNSVKSKDTKQSNIGSPLIKLFKLGIRGISYLKEKIIVPAIGAGGPNGK